MRINLKLTVRPTLRGEETQIDITEQLAEAVYQCATNYAMHKLAHKIDDSNGEFDVDDNEAKTLKNVLGQTQWKWFVQQPILEQLGERFE